MAQHYEQEPQEPIDPVLVPDSQKLPVTIISGFLGAGKTTLVNYILQQQHGMRIAVIENEFGAIGIDEELVQQNIRTAEDIISLDNGCVCCTVRSDLISALLKLAERRDQLDAVIIETTGLADPAPVCFTFSLDPEVCYYYRLDGVVCLVDVNHIEQHLDDVKPDGAVNEAVQQVVFADRLLINKTDLASREDISRVKERVHSINAFAELIETNSAEKCPLDKILGLHSFSIERVSGLVEWTEPLDHVCTEPNCTEDHRHGHSHGHGHGHGHNSKAPNSDWQLKSKHDLSGVSSVGLMVTGNINEDKFKQFMSSLLLKDARDLYRSKGLLALKGQDKKYVFQGVHEQIQWYPTEEAWEHGEERVSKMVFIGRNLDRDSLQSHFEACLTYKPPAIQCDSEGNIIMPGWS